MPDWGALIRSAALPFVGAALGGAQAGSRQGVNMDEFNRVLAESAERKRQQAANRAQWEAMRTITGGAIPPEQISAAEAGGLDPATIAPLLLPQYIRDPKSADVIRQRLGQMPELVGKVGTPQQAPMRPVKPGDYVPDPTAPGGYRQIGGSPLPKSELAAEEWLAANPNDPQASVVRQALKNVRASRAAQVGATTTARIEATKGAKTVGDTKQPWYDRNTGVKLPGNVPLTEAEQRATPLNANDAKMYETTNELLGWMKELGVKPDGSGISPEGEAFFERLFASKPSAGKVTWARLVRWWGTHVSGGDDIQKLNQVVSVLTTQFAKATAGTLRVNQSELQLIKAAHPGPTDTAATAIDKLKRITRYSQAIRQRMLSGVGAPPEDAPPFSSQLVPGQVPTAGALSPEESKAFGD